MTVIAAILSTDYALVLSDTRTSVLGPGEVRLPADAAVRIHLGRKPLSSWPDVLPVAEGQRVTIDGLHPGLDKVKFIPDDMTEAFAHAGTRVSDGPFLGLDAHRSGIEADRVIAQHFSTLASLDQVTDLPTGFHPQQEGMHVFHAKGRFYAATFGASPVHFTRRYSRSRPGELVHAVIGSGAVHVEKQLAESPEWQRLRTRTGVEHMRDVILLVGAALAKCCEVCADVNNQISCWARVTDAGVFEHHGLFEFGFIPRAPGEDA